MDAGLNNIANNGNILHICTVEPADYPGIGAVSKGSVALITGDGMGDYTIADGAVSGRRLSLDAQTITPSGSGIVTNLVIADTVSGLIKAITTCSPFGVTAGVPIEVDAYDIWEIRDPT
jgi:hypothetical protein